MKACSFRKLTLSAAAALVAISLSPGSAQADCAPGTPAGTCRVTVRGLQYDVSTLTGVTETGAPGTINNVSKFAPPPAPGAMPWWGDSVLASEFAAAVGKGLNVKPPGKVESTPTFAYKYIANGNACTHSVRNSDAGTLEFVKYNNSSGTIGRGAGMGWPPNLKWCSPDPYNIEDRTRIEKSSLWAVATLVPGP